ncbi:hypothetical protein [Pseudomonas sp. R32]|uniref:hypothetical protein n=1 Tax=Pseudomonas sp. R32 TaxID=1573704 RepID=UPI0013311CCC|nr:hypothetical protein [Pseudomonas sp. R32]
MDWVKSVIIKMTEVIMSDCSDLNAILDRINKRMAPVSKDLRHADNRCVVDCTGELLLNLVEQKYGRSTLEDHEICTRPAFLDSPRLRVGVTVSTTDNPDVVNLACIGTLVETWEQFFYELAHESVHLLGPADTNVVPVAAIEEGVAVKFAEDFYAEFIFPVTGVKPLYSPLTSPRSVYFKAHQSVSKMPDRLLKDVRREFENFHLVSNPGFYDMAKNLLHWRRRRC